MKIHLTLARAAASLTLTSHAASPIDCATALTPTENTVCSTPSLLEADPRMTMYFEIATQFVGIGVRGDLQDSQQAFLQYGIIAALIRPAFWLRIRSRRRHLLKR
jgi:uncharacterized protein